MRRRGSGVDLGSRGRRILSYLLTASLLVFLLHAVFADRGLVYVLRLSREANGVAEDIARIETENARLRMEISQLRGDPSVLERTIKERMDYIAPDELIYKFSESTQVALDRSRFVGQPRGN